mgnify:CR=1 FL=1
MTSMLDFLTRGARLSVDQVQHGQFTKTKQSGEGIDFTWPCTNSGNGDGTAFIRVTEAGLLVWSGAPFTVQPNQTVPLNLKETIDLPLGLHNLIAEAQEGFPPTGSKLIAADTLALTVVSNPILTPVGLPTIAGVLGPTLVTVLEGTTFVITWPCQNSGGGNGLARLRTVNSPLTIPSGTSSGLVTIPGFSTVTLLTAITASQPPFLVKTSTITLTMRDDNDVVLGTHLFVLVII